MLQSFVVVSGGKLPNHLPYHIIIKEVAKLFFKGLAITSNENFKNFS
jgi:hypothetical protein